MDILQEYACTELTIKNSRFIAEIFPVTTQQEARDILKSQKIKYSDASHVVHAFAVGISSNKIAPILGCSDDGEPPGTAGRPILEVLKGRSITNIVLTITRYFGGILLGTGGLVKAYGNSAKVILYNAKTISSIPRKQFRCSVSYELYEKIKRLCIDLDIEIINEDFGTYITIEAFVEECRCEIFTTQITEISSGKIYVRFIENN